MGVHVNRVKACANILRLIFNNESVIETKNFIFKEKSFLIEILFIA
jgi:hypothetical protein